ncbi:MAG: Glucose 1-dehydrogenase 1 [Syntrophorhabdus sp. PtaU1.Bin153]|nr:MAG: Glucose 1-dehydrogenase 1 [Syntrophorhabdus sp. PtaU1.Bin153]
MKLEGKVALITGAGTGIGAAIAERFVSEGARVCITGRRQEMLDQVAKSLPSGSVATCSGDVSKHEDAKRMVEATLAFGGRLDALVNNAGTDQPPSGVVDLDPAVWQMIIDTILTGSFLLIKESIPHMIKGGGGSVINIASLAGVRADPGIPAYCAAKGGLVMLSQQVALDYGRFNVRCNAVCPGGVDTAQFRRVMSGIMGMFPDRLGGDVEKVFEMVFKNQPLSRISKPHEMSGLCCYLASDDSSFMTGSVLLIDGGAAVVDPTGATISNLLERAGV